MNKFGSRFTNRIYTGIETGYCNNCSARADSNRAFLGDSRRNSSLKLYSKGFKDCADLWSMRRLDLGFTVIEVSVVMSLTLIAISVGVVQLRGSASAVDANSAGLAVVGQLHYAREIAVNQRRNVSIEFNSPDTIVINRHEPDATLTTIATTSLPTGFSFGLPTSAVGDTPDGYGADVPVDFNDGNHGMFMPDGTFVSDSGVVLSGTVFTIGATDGTARAVTLSGTTGRTMHYYIRNGAWIEKM